MHSCPHCGSPLDAVPLDPHTDWPDNPEGEEFDSGYVFHFGKYAGQKLESVMGTNPQYLLWAHNNVDHFNLSPHLLEEASKAARTQSPPRRSAPPRYFNHHDDDFDDDYHWLTLND